MGEGRCDKHPQPTAPKIRGRERRVSGERWPIPRELPKTEEHNNRRCHHIQGGRLPATKTRALDFPPPVLLLTGSRRRSRGAGPDDAVELRDTDTSPEHAKPHAICAPIRTQLREVRHGHPTTDEPQVVVFVQFPLAGLGLRREVDGHREAHGSKGEWTMVHVTRPGHVSLETPVRKHGPTPAAIRIHVRGPCGTVVPRRLQCTERLIGGTSLDCGRESPGENEHCQRSLSPHGPASAVDCTER
mmetsp:Transcript_102050/g.288167  ORF Transcript_102050/g.288167 Transcript_102050/m.288167 type:complete len:244 (-) Transcript_102050:326-1057(-)